MFAGEVGCAISHKRCYQRFLTDEKYKNTEYLLILEDGVEIPKNFKKILNNINSWKEKLPDYKFIKWDKGNQVFFFSSSFELFLFILKIKNFLARFKFYIKL